MLIRSRSEWRNIVQSGSPIEISIWGSSGWIGPHQGGRRLQPSRNEHDILPLCYQGCTRIHWIHWWQQQTCFEDGHQRTQDGPSKIRASHPKNSIPRQSTINTRTMNNPYNQQQLNIACYRHFYSLISNSCILDINTSIIHSHIHTINLNLDEWKKIHSLYVSLSLFFSSILLWIK